MRQTLLLPPPPLSLLPCGFQSPWMTCQARSTSSNGIDVPNSIQTRIPNSLSGCPGGWRDDYRCPVLPDPSDVFSLTPLLGGTDPTVMKRKPSGGCTFSSWCGNHRVAVSTSSIAARNCVYSSRRSSWNRVLSSRSQPRGWFSLAGQGWVR